MDLMDEEDKLLQQYFARTTAGQNALDRAQDKAADTRLLANLSKAASNFGSAIAGAKPADTSIADSIAQNADAPVERELKRQKVLSDNDKTIRDYFTRKETLAQQKQIADENRAQRAFDADENRKLRHSIAEMTGANQKANREQKQQQQVREIQERSNNIEMAIGKLQKMIGEKGTWEALGSHNQVLDGLVDQIAVDTAKLMDPESVARPAEVDLIKRSLIESGFRNKNATAQDILAKFQATIQDRVGQAYKVRGLQPPGGGQFAGGKVRVISPEGKPGLIPESQLEEALRSGYTKG